MNLDSLTKPSKKERAAEPDSTPAGQRPTAASGDNVVDHGDHTHALPTGAKIDPPLAFDKLVLELSRTAVISEGFRNTIVALAASSTEAAFVQGYVMAQDDGINALTDDEKRMIRRAAANMISVPLGADDAASLRSAMEKLGN